MALTELPNPTPSSRTAITRPSLVLIKRHQITLLYAPIPCLVTVTYPRNDLFLRSTTGLRSKAHAGEPASEAQAAEDDADAGQRHGQARPRGIQHDVPATGA